VPRGVELWVAGFVVLVGGLLTLNNLLPYVGMRDDSCQTMFSGLNWTARSNNHAFMPQRAIGDRWVYLVGVEASIDPVPSNARDRHLARWLDRPDRRLNIDAVRAVVRQLCEEHEVEITYRGRARDACADPYFSRQTWAPVRLYETDVPSGAE
jgi:hypothetical protein